jgi:hypothetical protein
MNVDELEEYRHNKHPIFFGRYPVAIIDIYHEFNLVDIKTQDGTILIIDAGLLLEKPYFEKSICLQRLIHWSETNA